MRAIHIMKDGTVRDTVEGIVIQDKQFYKVLQNILEKKKRGKANDLYRQSVC